MPGQAERAERELVVLLRDRTTAEYGIMGVNKRMVSKTYGRHDQDAYKVGNYLPVVLRRPALHRRQC